MRAEPGLTVSTDSGGAHPPESVRIWDRFVRVFHWSLVVLFVTAFSTAKNWQSMHEYAGYSIAALIAARVLWGFAGPRHARFSDFLHSPRIILQFLRDSLSMRAKRFVGHNPAGGAMVISLLLAVSIICATGYMMTTDMFWGVDWVGQVHQTAVYATLGLVALHIAGVVFASIEHSENLVKSMVTGRKRPE